MRLRYEALAAVLLVLAPVATSLDLRVAGAGRADVLLAAAALVVLAARSLPPLPFIALGSILWLAVLVVAGLLLHPTDDVLVEARVVFYGIIVSGAAWLLAIKDQDRAAQTLLAGLALATLAALALGVPEVATRLPYTSAQAADVVDAFGVLRTFTPGDPFAACAAAASLVLMLATRDVRLLVAATLTLAASVTVLMRTETRGLLLAPVLAVLGTFILARNGLRLRGAIRLCLLGAAATGLSAALLSRLPDRLQTGRAGGLGGRGAEIRAQFEQQALTLPFGKGFGASVYSPIPAAETIWVHNGFAWLVLKGGFLLLVFSLLLGIRAVLRLTRTQSHESTAAAAAMLAVAAVSLTSNNFSTYPGVYVIGFVAGLGAAVMPGTTRKLETLMNLRRRV